jgi:DNA-binding transcriptional ArsR family regulator
MAKNPKQKNNISKKVYEKNAEMYKILANPKRLEIMYTIRDKEATVNELSKIIGARKSNTSQHLAYLRYTGLVKARREGKNIFYKLTDPKILDSFKV